MRIFLVLTMAAVAACGQQQPAPKPGSAEAAAAAAAQKLLDEQKKAGPAKAPAAAPAMNIMGKAPDTVIATVDGKKVTAGEMQAIVKAFAPQMQQQLLNNPQQFLVQYGMMRRLATDAENEKLSDQSPWKEMLDYNRLMVLSQAEINRKTTTAAVNPEESKKYYEENKARFVAAKVKGIYIPFSNEPVSKKDDKGKPVLSEPEAKAKAESLAKEARGGADFVKLVKENSGDATSAAKDGDLGTIRKSDPLPQPLKTAVFAAKAGDVTDPIKQGNGYYVLRIQESGTQPYDEVQNAIAEELKGRRFAEWMSALQKSIDVKMEPASASDTSSPRPAPGPAAQK